MVLPVYIGTPIFTMWEGSKIITRKNRGGDVSPCMPNNFSNIFPTFSGNFFTTRHTDKDMDTKTKIVSD